MLKKQKLIKDRLKKQLKEVCYQIGIPAVEEPKLTFSIEQFKWYSGIRKKDKYVLGRSCFPHNCILVDIYNHKNYTINGQLVEKYGSMTEFRDTLIHELVHIRFQNMKHGSQFRQTISDIKKGKIYPIRTNEDLRQNYVYQERYYPTKTHSL